MASIVLLLSLFVRTKNRSQVSTIAASSSDNSPDKSGWHLGRTKQGENDLGIRLEEILQEPKFSIHLI
ncbi:hypothetical protein LR48_Vigan03g205400 [Vigna angularis]|uniref:Uncharacterized protein n=2 Tax=Phaseolus angularis TaxID=3914 RepID=A0A0L9U7R1_PHAAN|nr:hypothetical protein LR48_Vigan03g205400 [Vigna angularis]BAT85044.1 hypothetical protein VIGAN_04253600 [Vigna angularis var. angularis]